MKRAAMWIVLLACSKADPPSVPLSAATATESGSARLIFRDDAGHQITPADLANTTGNVQWELVGGADVPAAAVALHEQAREAGGKGDYAAAIDLLAKAQAAAPSWPYPLYDTAYTYELMGEPAKALAAYDKTLALAPRGYFTAQTSAACLRRELAHEWNPGICKRYAMLEFEQGDARQAALEAIVKEAPGVAAAWKDLALALPDGPKKLAMFDTALAHDPDPATRGLVLVNQALALDRAGKRDQAIQILGPLAVDPNAPLDVAAMSKLALAQITAPANR